MELNYTENDLRWWSSGDLRLDGNRLAHDWQTMHARIAALEKQAEESRDKISSLERTVEEAVRVLRDLEISHNGYRDGIGECLCKAHIAVFGFLSTHDKG